MLVVIVGFLSFLLEDLLAQVNQLSHVVHSCLHCFSFALDVANSRCSERMKCLAEVVVRNISQRRVSVFGGREISLALLVIASVVLLVVNYNIVHFLELGQLFHFVLLCALNKLSQVIDCR